MFVVSLHFLRAVTRIWDTRTDTQHTAPHHSCVHWRLCVDVHFGGEDQEAYALSLLQKSSSPVMAAVFLAVDE